MRNVFFTLTFMLCALLIAGCASSQKRAAPKRAHRTVVKSAVAQEIQLELLNMQYEIRKAAQAKAEGRKLAEEQKAQVKAEEALALRTPATVPFEVVQIDEPQLPESEKKKHEATPVLVNPEFASGDIAADAEDQEVTIVPSGPLKSLKNFEDNSAKLSPTSESTMVFQLPVTYNSRVRKWIQYYQTEGRASFRRYLERSTRWLPYIHDELQAANMPMDLMYVALVESGFTPEATSPAGAVGMWQFIAPTASRYGLRTSWWIDERRDVYKSTRAAIHYMTDLHRMFGSWYLVAASYNMGENGVARLVRRHSSQDFWELADKGVLPEETKNYVPKIIAAMLIAKAPALYGFRDLDYDEPYTFDYYDAPGGTDLTNLASYLGVPQRQLRDLNPELLHGIVPAHVRSYRMRVPRGTSATVAKYVEMSR